MSGTNLALGQYSGQVPGTNSAITVHAGKTIAEVEDVIGSETGGLPFISAGLIDLQVNGFAGVDYNDPSSSHEGIARSLRVMFSTGVTRCFPTIITGSEQRIVAAIRNLAAAKREFDRSGLPEGDAIAGLHIEGPHLSPEDGPRGAHPLEHIRPPDTDEFDRWQDAGEGLVRLVTVSPEWEGTPGYVRHLIRSGVVASIGHTKATGAQIRAAVDAGATMSTHLGNAAHPVLPKTENYIWNQAADDRLAASFIADGIHLPADFLKAVVRAKGVERSVLVTDAVMPAMCPPGFYQLGQVEVELHEGGRVSLRGSDRLAGSALRMDDAIGNAVRLGRLSLREALAMATANAARAGRVAGRLRGLTPGEKGDLILFSWDEATYRLRVDLTVVSGNVAYRAAA